MYLFVPHTLSLSQAQDRGQILWIVELYLMFYRSRLDPLLLIHYIHFTTVLIRNKNLRLALAQYMMRVHFGAF